MLPGANDERSLSTFAGWLTTLPDDARMIAQIIGDEAVPVSVRRPLVGALNYLFKSLDLIDDGIESLGFLDDAFVLRASVANAVKSAVPPPEELLALGADELFLREFLGDLGVRFRRYVDGLVDTTVRGRSVEDVLSDAVVREELIGEVIGWAARYERPVFTAEAKNLVKFRSFLATKLPV
jgi:uncharacterized membrane protein YkvA (DUF1232 family)